MTVLLVEQDALVRRVLRSRLDRAGFAVSDAATAMDALSLPRTGVQPTVLVTNARHGLEWTLSGFILEAKRRWPHLRVVLISGWAIDDEGRAVADRFLAKPFAAGDLIEAVTELACAGPLLQADAAT